MNNTIITESKLIRIIESISSTVLKIIDYVKSFGQKGRLPDFNGKLQDCYEDGLQTAFEWAKESTDDVGRNGIVWLKWYFRTHITANFTFNKRGLIYVERSIDFNMSDDLSALQFKSIGECWSWKRFNSQSYCSTLDRFNTGTTQVILCGYVHPNSIDWTETIYLNVYKMKKEREIRLNDNAFVEVAYIKICGQKYPLGGSYILNASADKYNKNKENW